MYDGALGIICAISALKVLKNIGKLDELLRPVEVSGSFTRCVLLSISQQWESLLQILK